MEPASNPTFTTSDMLDGIFSAEEQNSNPRGNPFVSPFEKSRSNVSGFGSAPAVSASRVSGFGSAPAVSGFGSAPNNASSNLLIHYGFSPNDPILESIQNMEDYDPFAIQILKNSKRFRERTGFKPKNHRIIVNYDTVEDIDGNLTINS